MSSSSDEPWPDHSLTLIMGVPLPESASDEAIHEAVGDGFELQKENYSADVTADFAERGIDVSSHGKVVYVISPSFTQETAIENCVVLAKAVMRLLALGGLGVKCESSNTMHPPEAFKKLVELFSQPKSDEEYVYALMFTFVACVIEDDKDFFSAGMHLLGYPDAIMDKQMAGRRFGGYEEMMELFRTFEGYMILGQDPQRFASGHTFSLSEDAPPFRQQWEPCHNYRPDGILFNPFGRYRLESPVAAGKEQ